MNEFEKMKAGEWADVSAPEIVEARIRKRLRGQGDVEALRLRMLGLTLNE